MGNQNSAEGGSSSISLLLEARRKPSFTKGVEKSACANINDMKSQNELLKGSKSMCELASTAKGDLRRQSIGARHTSRTKQWPAGGAMKSATSVGYTAAEEDKYLNGYGSATNPHRLSTSSGGSFARQRSVRKSDVAGHPISSLGREIIKTCFDNPHIDLGMRICTRLYERRADYFNFILQMGKERFYQQAQSLKELLDSVVANIDYMEKVEKLARKYGEEHVQLRSYGFKPDFWVSLADALAVEGVILDQAAHQPTDAISAWSLFVSILFSHIRDGYYSALRAQRISTRRKSVREQHGSLQKTPSVDAEANEQGVADAEESEGRIERQPSESRVTFAEVERKPSVHLTPTTPIVVVEPVPAPGTAVIVRKISATRAASNQPEELLAPKITIETLPNL